MMTTRKTRNLPLPLSVWTWALLGSLACLPACSSKPQKPGQFTSKKDGFSIVGPASWEKVEGFMGTAVMFKEPLAGSGDNFADNVNIVVENLPAGMALDGYVKASNENMTKMLTDLREMSSARVKLGGNEAYRVVFAHKMGIFDLKALSYLVVAGGRGYCITCTSTTAEYDSHEPVFEDICKSFETH